MAERRMFAKSVIDSDLFLDMPQSAQCLYFHLAMRADDDGFVAQPRSIMRMLGNCEDDMRLLIAKQFLFLFDKGVVVIRHWKVHNYIRNDRYKPTIFQGEKATLYEDKSRVYQCGIPDDNQLVDQVDTQVRLGKDRLGQSRLGEQAAAEPENRAVALFASTIGEPAPHQLQEVTEYCAEMTDEVVVRAIQTALDAGVPKWSYVRSILEDKKKRGVHCIEDWDKLQTAASNHSQPSHSTRPPAGSAGTAPLGDFEKQFLANLMGRNGGAANA